LVLAFIVYSPALHGPFVFDDSYLPNVDEPLGNWIHGGRKLLMLTYWWNASQAGGDTFQWHVLNVLIHVINTGLVYLIVRRLAPDTNRLLAGFAAGLFLLHPMQTEAVAYLSGRSEEFSVMFAFAAYAVFLWRKQPAVSWRVAVAVMVLFGMALLSKEHTIVLPAVLLLTDLWWNPGTAFEGVRRNWRLYLAMVLGAVAGVASFWSLITQATSAGFSLKDFTWYQYFFTECRALWVYIGEFLFPVRLNADWDFPISHTIIDHGAVIGLIALIGGIALAWRYRKRFPLACFGFLLFLLLMAPTSSILPIQDPIAERRVYFAMPGLLLIVVDVLSRIRLTRQTLTAVCGIILMLAAGATYARAHVWGEPIALWQDTVAKSPRNFRAHLQLAQAYVQVEQTSAAVAEYQKASELGPPTYGLLVDWGLALNSAGKADQALTKLRQAAALNSTAHVYSNIGMVYAMRSDWDPALQALEIAEKLDPNYGPTFVNRGHIRLKQNDCKAAIPEYTRALQIDAHDNEAKKYLSIAQTCAARGR
jgi:tetratricopeptide (TPR) repeat protein